MPDDLEPNTTPPPPQEVPTTRRRGRRTRTNYAAKYAELQTRIDQAVRILRECTGDPDGGDGRGVTSRLVRIALKTLAGEG